MQRLASRSGSSTASGSFHLLRYRLVADLGLTGGSANIGNSRVVLGLYRERERGKAPFLLRVLPGIFLPRLTSK
jgi:hypothetical protein